MNSLSISKSILLSLCLGLPLVANKAYAQARPTGWQEFFSAVDAGDADKVATLIQANPRVIMAVRPYGESGLHVAAKKGHLDVVKLLLKAGADLNYARRGADRTPLDAAIKAGHQQIAEYLIGRGADENRGQALLSAVAHRGWPDTIKLLVSRGADPTLKTPNGTSPLTWATLSDHQDCVALLKSLKVKTDLHAACALGDAATVAKLAKSNPKALSANLRSVGTPLHVAVRFGNLELAESLLKAGANVNAQSGRVGTPLHDALRSPKIEMIQLLIESGADVNALNEYSKTPLDASWFDRKSRQFLMERGALRGYQLLGKLPRVRPPFDGKSIQCGGSYLFPGGGEYVDKGNFFYAIKNVDGERRIEIEFFEEGKQVVAIEGPDGTSFTVTEFVDKKPLNKQYKTLEAVKKADPDVLKFYRKYQSRFRMNQIIPGLVIGRWMQRGPASSSIEPHREFLELLLKANAEPIKRALAEQPSLANVRTREEFRPLHYAIEAGDLQSVGLLLELEADVNAAGRDEVTPLHTAAANGHLEIVKLLLDQGAKVRVKTRWDRTALHFAIATGHKEVVNVLLAAKAPLFDRSADRRYDAPLALAAQTGRLDLVEVILHGAALDSLADQQLPVAIDHARKRGFQAILTRLEEVAKK